MINSGNTPAAVDAGKQNDIFSITRFLQLCRVGLQKDFRSLLIKTGGVVGFFILTSLINGFTRQPAEYFSAYGGIFVVAGIFITAGSFRDYYRRDRNAFYLTLPASTLEKWLEKWLASTLGWMAFSFLVFTVYTFLAAGLNELLFGFHSSPFWWQKELGLLYLNYLVVQSVFFLGSAVFRKIALFKTGLSLFALLVFLGLLLILTVKIIFPAELQAIIGMNSPGGTGFYMDLNGIPMELVSWGETLSVLGRIFYWGLIMPFCWLVSGIRFREIEVKDGV